MRCCQSAGPATAAHMTERPPSSLSSPKRCTSELSTARPAHFMQIMTMLGMASERYWPQPRSASRLQPCHTACSLPRSLGAAVGMEGSRVAERHGLHETIGIAVEASEGRRSGVTDGNRPAFHRGIAATATTAASSPPGIPCNHVAADQQQRGGLQADHRHCTAFRGQGCVHNHALCAWTSGRAAPVQQTATEHQQSIIACMAVHGCAALHMHAQHSMHSTLTCCAIQAQPHADNQQPVEQRGQRSDDRIDGRVWCRHALSQQRALERFGNAQAAQGGAAGQFRVSGKATARAASAFSHCTCAYSRLSTARSWQAAALTRAAMGTATACSGPPLPTALAPAETEGSWGTSPFQSSVRQLGVRITVRGWAITASHLSLQSNPARLAAAPPCSPQHLTQLPHLPPMCAPTCPSARNSVSDLSHSAMMMRENTVLTSRARCGEQVHCEQPLDR